MTENVRTEPHLRLYRQWRNEEFEFIAVYVPDANGLETLRIFRREIEDAEETNDG